MVTKTDMQMIAFQIIAQIGESRTQYMMALDHAKKGDFTLAHEAIASGKENHTKASTLHLDLVQQEAKGEDLPFSLILMHAEDQMLTNEAFKTMAEEFTLLREELSKK